MTNIKTKNEKIKISKVNIATDHRLIRDKWLNTKKILDLMYKLLSPFEKGEQIISVDPKTLLPDQQKLFEAILKDLVKSKVTKYDDYEKNSLVTSASPIRQYFDGKVIIISRKKNLKITEIEFLNCVII